ncbi:MAG: hypothetical protein KBT03_07980 [Bacteroidales bacterium]|nr:hypothetical protein [Candidatus Scybalousia scybalohippi]
MADVNVLYNYVSKENLSYTVGKVKDLLDTKVDKVSGMGLSHNDYTDEAVAEVAKIANKVDKIEGKGLSTNDYDNAAVAEVAKIANKVDKETGKGLSTNDYDNAAVEEVAKIQNKVDKEAGMGLSQNSYTDDEKAAVATIGNKVDKVDGKGLSTNDYDDDAVAEVAKVAGKADKATTLAGYGIADAYTKDETTAAITDAVKDITSFDYAIPDGGVLPETGVKGTIYLIPNSGQGTNVYDEYIWVNGKFEMLGTTEMDLSGYVKKSDMAALTEAEIDAMFA